ncbi:hypothetical protein [Cellvibrio mixtus]|nr:hypothetical protein [Cellvibrio mixtus]
MAKVAHYQHQVWLNDLGQNESLEASEPTEGRNYRWGEVIPISGKPT